VADLRPTRLRAFDKKRRCRAMRPGAASSFSEGSYTK
jgi:hypothetical protein